MNSSPLSFKGLNYPFTRFLPCNGRFPSEINSIISPFSLHTFFLLSYQLFLLTHMFVSSNVASSLHTCPPPVISLSSFHFLCPLLIFSHSCRIFSLLFLLLLTLFTRALILGFWIRMP